MTFVREHCIVCIEPWNIGLRDVCMDLLKLSDVELLDIW